jgi:hypothetical protein
VNILLFYSLVNPEKLKRTHCCALAIHLLFLLLYPCYISGMGLPHRLGGFLTCFRYLYLCFLSISLISLQRFDICTVSVFGISLTGILTFISTVILPLYCNIYAVLVQFLFGEGSSVNLLCVKYASGGE